MPEKMVETLYRSSKITLEFFMFMPEINKWNDTYSMSPRPMLNLRKLNPSSMNDDATGFKERTFRITPSSLYRVVKFFNKIVSWFYDESMRDLFLKNEDGKLIFNGDYKDIHAYVEAGFSTVDRMKALPAAIDTENESIEGIYLMINNTENIVVLTLKEVEILLDILTQFSFRETMLTMLLAVDMANRKNEIRESNPNAPDYNKPKW